MERREWKFVDHSAWGQGPWSDEPDKVQWPDPSTGLPCLAVRGRLGSWCGYVGVGPGHRFYGVDYMECAGRLCTDDYCEHRPESNLEVHGGITFSGFCQAEDKEQGICHTEPNDPRYWFGFDCGHFQDLQPGLRAEPGMAAFIAQNSMWPWREVYRDLAYVQAQCTALAAQLFAMT
jgi:hypothetical protein